MTPEAAFEMQIERYRQMSPAQRIELALRLHELASEVARSGIRAQNPRATEDEVEEMLRERRRLAYRL
jgi:Rv0078B-related antitoxin